MRLTNLLCFGSLYAQSMFLSAYTEVFAMPHSNLVQFQRICVGTVLQLGLDLRALSPLVCFLFLPSVSSHRRFVTAGVKEDPDVLG